MLKIAIGHTEEIDSDEAAEEILEQCKAELGEEKATAGILYASIDHEFDSLLKKINEEHPDIELIGCTTDGELSSVIGFAEDSVTLILFSSDEIDIKAGVADGVSEGLEQKIADSIKNTKDRSDKELKLCILNPVSITSSGAVILEIFKQSLGENFPIFGASAADQWKFEQTYQFHKTEVLTDAVPFLLFSGNLLIGSGVDSGWTPIGNPGKVTRVENNILYSIDDKTAVEFFQHYLGENITPLGEYPLAVFENEESDKFYLRAPLASNMDDGSLVFAGDLTLGAKVQISHTTRDRIIEASERSISQSFESYSGKEPEVAICFSCSGRKQVLGTRTSEEYELLKKVNPDLKVFGLYGYGEIAPIYQDSPSRFHNETFVSLLLGTK
ncbi:MAG: FIST C-terminal domain-containing protein [SAR324 cluster bacterium]|nr:FIST C-terminal domain-containing protein [SAR324 cluster bacterium]